MGNNECNVAITSQIIQTSLSKKHLQPKEFSSVVVLQFNILNKQEMKLPSIITTIVILLTSHVLLSSDLKIQNVRAVQRDGVAQTPPSVIFDLSWENAWNNEKNHDAIWLFMKFAGPWNNHVKLANSGHKILHHRTGSASSLELNVVDDGLGMFIQPSQSFRGDIDIKLQIVLDTSSQEVTSRKMTGLSVHGLEMVYIPSGPFFLGSPDDKAIEYASFYVSDDNGNPNGLYRIESEEEISIGSGSGKLYYQSENDLYNGDRKGPVPASFPKGFNSFYIMKYELTQGQYVDFLNKLPDGWTFTRSPIAGKGYYKKRGTIKLMDGNYFTDHPQRPMNFISFTDGLAYTDWAGLRPLTELEFTKAARGPRTPSAAEFVWGTNHYDQLERYVSREGDLVFTHGLDEADLSDENLSSYGASHYWVMDLSGSLWEKVITIGNSVGRSFKGSHGDGRLRFGTATNEDWPTSDNELGGFGYRGGGYYQVGTIYSDFNPHSPVGYRYYGSWSGGPRSIAYGYRAGRTAPKM